MFYYCLYDSKPNLLPQVIARLGDFLNPEKVFK